MMTAEETKNCPYCAEEIRVEAVKCKHCGSWLSPAPGSYGPAPQRLTRSSTDRIWAGVCGGAGRYIGVDPTIVRVAVAVATVFTGFLPGLALYLILRWVVPLDTEV